MDWAHLSAALAEELADLPAGALVVVYEAGKETGRFRFAQFAQDEDRLSAEIVTNGFLVPEVRATPDGEELIRRAGWRAPEVREGHDIWWYSLPWPSPPDRYRELAEMVVTALRDGYGASGQSPWAYDAWNERQGNSPLELPRLRLPRGNRP
ncbi:hypothetical protein GCM10009678_48020 [Actinomadura kijaniata]|uniref:TY-Chap N-terminal domain-containing protein n=1 Tax=Actinomadura namibiensis TaxID=182080 RepID=A0A7W3LWG1_ACTNM|nr:hypothetical protein [Actinomadura namibiensis]MBA8955548.1 hypothetical protein [Actinomadura namibiensis]